MANPQFPDIQKYSNQFEITPEEPGMSSEQENGSVVSRARFTRSRLTYSRHWNAMPGADWTTLLSFYQNTVKGCSSVCDWGTETGRIYCLRGQSIGGGKYAVSLTWVVV
jgi:hypothetical protein